MEIEFPWRCKTWRLLILLFSAWAAFRRYPGVVEEVLSLESRAKRLAVLGLA